MVRGYREEWELKPFDSRWRCESGNASMSSDSIYRQPWLRIAVRARGIRGSINPAATSREHFSRSPITRRRSARRLTRAVATGGRSMSMYLIPGFEKYRSARAGKMATASPDSTTARHSRGVVTTGPRAIGRPDGVWSGKWIAAHAPI